MPRFGTKRKVAPAPRGIIGAVLMVAIAVALVWLAFYREPWLPQPAPSSTATSTPIAEQYELTEADQGKTFTYPLTSRFTVILDGSRYPAPTCVPAGILGPISNIPAVQAPLVATRFEAVMPGSCTLTAGGWSVVVMVTGEGQ